jgi:hypothetical protein
MNEFNLKTGQIPDSIKMKKSFEQFNSLFESSLIELERAVINVQPSLESKLHWKKLINEWVRDKEIPLYVRKFNHENSRGKLIKHKTDRLLIPADNGPAHWSFSMCYNNNLVSLKSVKEMIKRDQIPVAYILKKIEKANEYIQTNHLIDQPNKKGWKICHINPVGIKKRTDLKLLPIEDIENHFLRLMDPCNMFLIPIELSGLAEIKRFIDILKTNK